MAKQTSPPSLMRDTRSAPCLESLFAKRVGVVLLFAIFLVLCGCGASQGGVSGSRVAREAGTDRLDHDGDRLDDEPIFGDIERDPPPPPEQNEVCGDGEDNDGDTDIDCADVDCALLPQCAEPGL